MERTFRHKFTKFQKRNMDTNFEKIMLGEELDGSAGRPHQVPPQRGQSLAKLFDALLKGLEQAQGPRLHWYLSYFLGILILRVLF